MPKRKDIKKIMILGAGPIIIGQACEFDYSGVQACKALKEEGYNVVLINSNVATIMTDPDVADSTYIEPLTPEIVTKIIRKEKPNALLPTMGGQTALNCALELEKLGVLKKFKVEMIGAKKDSINLAEDRELFKKAMNEIGLNSAKSYIARDFATAKKYQKKIGYPVIIRPSFTLGGSGGGIAYNDQEFSEIVNSGLEISPTTEVLLEESLLGWKEYEMEVVRDRNDNCIIVCSIENIDPMGIHTGDSITVAPAQTLTDKEYQLMRNASIDVLRKIGVDTGGSNVQFAINPDNGKMVVIEMNPRVSRSSALASKATGFPIAKVASKLAVGYTLDELRNEITQGIIPASFEPTIDYTVVKIPRFAFEKFPNTNDRLTTQMKSVGEVMAIGRCFTEALLKAISGLEYEVNGLEPWDGIEKSPKGKLETEIKDAGPKRIWYLAEAFRRKYSIKKIFDISKIDMWFLEQINFIIQQEIEIKKINLKTITKDKFLYFKKIGFSDIYISKISGLKESEIRKFRKKRNIHPSFKRVDTCAAEFPTSTSYLYSTYENNCESKPTNKDKIIVIGSGPNRIGQGIEFDYCCVHASLAAKELGYETIMINCNPETVSTDFDTSDRLYFEPITSESVLNIINLENPLGVIVQYGGQTPLKLVNELEKNNVPIIGTSASSIDAAEDRKKFQAIIKKLKIKQPNNKTVVNSKEALIAAKKIGYPVIVRPSYVLGGRAMEVIFNNDELAHYITDAVHVSDKSPVLIDKFLHQALEVDVDAIRDKTGEVFIAAIMQHIEEAGVHSGDSACCIPPYSLPNKTLNLIKKYTEEMANELNVIGLMNVQFAVKGDEIFVLEVNPRASRTVPFVSKSIGIPIAKVGAKCMLGITLKSQKLKKLKHNLFTIKEAVFPFIKFPGADPILGPEMKSTGEVMGVGKTFGEAFLKSQLASSVLLPSKGIVLMSIKDEDKEASIKIAQKLSKIGFKIVATKGTAEFLKSNKIPCKIVNKVREGRPHIVDMIKNNEVNLIINTTQSKQAISDSYLIRREALQHKICYTTTISGAQALSESIINVSDLNVFNLQAIYKK